MTLRIQVQHSGSPSGQGQSLTLLAAVNGRIALSATSRDAHIWAVPIDKSGHPAGPPAKLTATSAGEHPEYLPRDGRKLIRIKSLRPT